MEGRQQSRWYIPGGSAIGAVFRDGVVLAAEKLITYGHFVASKVAKKTFTVRPYVGVVGSGLIGDLQKLIQILEVNVNLYEQEMKRPISVKGVARLLSVVMYSAKHLPYLIQVIVGGVDRVEGPTLYVMDPLGSVIKDDYGAVGTGGEIITGILERMYRKDVNVKEGEEIVVNAMKAAYKRDVLSGDAADILVITKDGATEKTVSLKG